MRDETQKATEAIRELAKAFQHGAEPSMTLSEAAAFLRVHPNRMSEYNAKGLRHIVGMSKGILYLKSDLVEWRERYLVVRQDDFIDQKIIELKQEFKNTGTAA